MGRKPRFGAGYEIINAQRLFEKSVLEEKADFRFVALAIGASPAAPPDWAILECISLRRAVARSAARGNRNDVADILDELVAHFDLEQRNFEAAFTGQIDWASFPKPNLNGAIKKVLARLGIRRTERERSDPDSFKDIILAWNWEQQNDAAPASYFRLEGWKTTSRIDRVMKALVGDELGYPADIETLAWLAKKL